MFLRFENVEFRKYISAVGSWALFHFVPKLFYRSYFVSHKLHFSNKSIMMKMASE